MDIRRQFPILETKIKHNQLVYLDNAATTQKPQTVIDSIAAYYSTSNSNIHRGAHFLANIATEHYEITRTKVASFIHSAYSHEIIFTSGTTQSINLLAQAWGAKFLNRGDIVVLTEMEHHANIVPWLHLSKTIGIELRYLPMTNDCELDMATLNQIITPHVKLVSLAHTSNAIGSHHPIQRIIQVAKSHNALVHIDAAQAIQHTSIDVQELGVDFLSFSCHKMYGPMGTGVFWGRSELLDSMDPYLYGGEMIKEVFLDHFTTNELPFKFEAGTPNVGDVIGLGAAIDFIQSVGYDCIIAHEKQLQTKLRNKLLKIEGIQMYTPVNSSSVISFNIEKIHAYDLGQMLDAKGIAVRTGHHCCQPLMRKLKIEGTCRASLAIYNTEYEIDYFLYELNKILSILR